MTAAQDKLREACEQTGFGLRLPSTCPWCGATKTRENWWPAAGCDRVEYPCGLLAEVANGRRVFAHGRCAAEATP